MCLWIDFTYLENDQLLELLTTDDNKNSSQYLLSIYSRTLFQVLHEGL